jgi:hypothetical protein
MLEVSLPVVMIELFKMTCRNYSYYVDGKISSITTFRKGKRYGKCIGYDEYGYIEFIARYKKGKIHGKHTWWGASHVIPFAPHKVYTVSKFKYGREYARGGIIYTRKNGILSRNIKKQLQLMNLY